MNETGAAQRIHRLDGRAVTSVTYYRVPDEAVDAAIAVSPPKQWSVYTDRVEVAFNSAHYGGECGLCVITDPAVYKAERQFFT